MSNIKDIVHERSEGWSNDGEFPCYLAGTWESRFILFLSREKILDKVVEYCETVFGRSLFDYLSERSFLVYFDSDVDVWYSRKWLEVVEDVFDKTLIQQSINNPI